MAVHNFLVTLSAFRAAAAGLSAARERCRIPAVLGAIGVGRSSDGYPRKSYVIRPTKLRTLLLLSPCGAACMRLFPKWDWQHFEGLLFVHSSLSFVRVIAAFTFGLVRSPKIDSGFGLTQSCNT